MYHITPNFQPTPTPTAATSPKKQIEMSTDKEYKAALLQSRQAANFTTPTMSGSCVDCLGIVCPNLPNGNKRDCWVDIVKKPAECRCFDIATPPSLPWIKRKEGTSGTREIALQIARANLTTPTQMY